ncbi:MAG: hypothetical protein ACJA1E_001897 [Paracoccaceae bacterium]|jgi:hypothetical protein
MSHIHKTDTATGFLLIATMVLVMSFEWSGVTLFSYLGMGSLVCALGLLSLQVAWSRRLFVIIGLVLSLLAVLRLPDWPQAVGAALKSASFIVAFFTALTTLRSAAITSAPIAECGRFLAEQPPGRRYLALTLGGSLFGLILMYGAISLLGSLAAASAMREQNAEIRAHRLRRMLIAIQRGFIATLPWSPLAFATAVSISLVPGASWANAVLPCMVSGVLLGGIGWGLDTMFKPKLSRPSPVAVMPDGAWAAKLRPLLVLLVVLVGITLSLHFWTGVRTVGVVMAVVPLLALLWAIEQAVFDRRSNPVGHVAARAGTYVTTELPGNRSELVLLAMAGFIGALGASLTQPLIVAAGIDLSGVPAWALLLGIFWLIPITGQFGMNPILSVSLIAPLLPSPEVMNVDPAAVIVAITGGWALSGATSPYTASTLLIASLGKVSASHVGLRWNGPYALTCALGLSVWICVAALVL